MGSAAWDAGGGPAPHVLGLAVAARQMADLLVVIFVILNNWQAASVYFWLAVISGILVFSSCVFGKHLADQTPAPPPLLTPYISRAPSRAQSVHGLSYLGGGGSMAPTLKLHSPTHSYGRHTLVDCSGKMRGESEETDESYPWIFLHNEKKHEFKSQYL